MSIRRSIPALDRAAKRPEEWRPGGGMPWPRRPPRALTVSTQLTTTGTKFNVSTNEQDVCVFLGDFAGVNVSLDGSVYLPVKHGTAVLTQPYLRAGSGIFVSKDAGGSGTVKLASSFDSIEAAMAFREMIVGSEGPLDSSGTATGVKRTGNYAFDGASWDPVWADVYNDAASAPSGTPSMLRTGAFNFVYNDRTGNVDRLRQPDSFTNQRGVGPATALSTTGTKLTMTLATDGWLFSAIVGNISGANFAGNIQVRVQPLGVGSFVCVGQNNAAMNIGQTYNLVNGTGTPGSPIPLLATDVVEINVVTATAASVADLVLGIRRQRGAF